MRLVHWISGVLVFSLTAPQLVPAQLLLGRITELNPPVAAGSAQPFLSVSTTGVFYLSWMEPGAKTKHAFRFASFDGSKWSAARTIAEADDYFVNWADVPSILPHSDGTLIAHWLNRSGPSTYAYDVQLSFSRDGGNGWSNPLTPHRDGTQTEHGFVSLFELPGHKVGLIWLDGRQMIMAEASDHSGHGSGGMTLRSAVFSTDGKLEEEHLIDPLVCECCPTAVTPTQDGILIAYRDRSPEEVRNIFTARLSQGKWSSPQLVFDDGWKIPGCPVNGPAFAREGNMTAIAWFTAPEGAAQVNVAFSNDAGTTFSRPLRVDGGKPLGRVGINLLPGGTALVVWLEYGDNTAELRGRLVSPTEDLQDSFLIASVSADRASGYPRVARSGRRVLFAWTETGSTKKVKVAEVLLQSK